MNKLTIGCINAPRALSEEEKDFIMIVETMNNLCSDDRISTDKGTLFALSELSEYTKLVGSKKYVFYNQSRDKDKYLKVWFEV